MGNGKWKYCEIGDVWEMVNESLFIHGVRNSLWLPIVYKVVPFKKGKKNRGSSMRAFVV